MSYHFKLVCDIRLLVDFDKKGERLEKSSVESFSCSQTIRNDLSRLFRITYKKFSKIDQKFLVEIDSRSWILLDKY